MTTPAVDLPRPDANFLRLLEVMPAAAYTCDADGLITNYNPPAVELWGRRPLLNHPLDRYCGSHKLFSTGGDAIPLDRCWMALALLENRAYNREEIVVERPDGTRRTAVAHANPFHDGAGRVVGAVNILVDVTDCRDAEDELRRVTADIEASVRERTARLEATVRELRASSAAGHVDRGMVPICSWCKKVRDEAGFWLRVEQFIQTLARVEFTHGICPGCFDSYFAVHRKAGENRE